MDEDLSTGPTQISDTWERGDPYEQFIGRWSRKVAPVFLSWMGCSGGLTWLDVGCGTGALCGAILDGCSPVRVAGVEPSAGFLKAARANLASQAALFQGSGTQIPLKDAAVDIVVSGLVLNFMSDPRAALIEMARVTRKGGAIGAYLWDYADKMELLRLFWDAAVELDPDAVRLDEGIRFPLCNPHALRNLFTSVGLSGIQCTAIDVQARFASFAEVWQPFLGSQGPAPTYVMALNGNARARLRDLLLKRMPVETGGAISLTARAWAIRADVAEK